MVLNLNKNKKIEFFSYINGVADAFPIKEAKEFKPNWMEKCKQDYVKKLDLTNTAFNHVYQCPGIFDLYKHGFIVSLWTDVVIQTDKTKKGFGWAAATINHPEQQNRIVIDKHKDDIGDYIPHRPYSLPFVIKINSPWSIIAPKGVKFLMLPISYPDTHNFDNAIGILDPSINTEINFQIWWNVLDGEVVLKAGTPMVHLVPVSEQKFDFTVRDATEHDRAWLEKRQYFHHYSFRPNRNIIKEFYYKHFKR